MKELNPSHGHAGQLAQLQVEAVGDCKAPVREVGSGLATPRRGEPYTRDPPCFFKRSRWAEAFSSESESELAEAFYIGTDSEANAGDQVGGPADATADMADLMAEPEPWSPRISAPIALTPLPAFPFRGEL